MNDREALKALLDGKVIVDESSQYGIQIRLIGDRICVKPGKLGWALIDHISALDSCHLKILEDEE